MFSAVKDGLRLFQRCTFARWKSDLVRVTETFVNEDVAVEIVACVAVGKQPGDFAVQSFAVPLDRRDEPGFVRMRHVTLDPLEFFDAPDQREELFGKPFDFCFGRTFAATGAGWFLRLLSIDGHGGILRLRVSARGSWNPRSNLVRHDSGSAGGGKPASTNARCG